MTLGNGGLLSVICGSCSISLEKGTMHKNSEKKQIVPAGDEKGYSHTQSQRLRSRLPR